MLTKSATLMPAADLPPSGGEGALQCGRICRRAERGGATMAGLLTKSKRAGTRQKRKSKIWRVQSPPNRAQIHAKKKKARFGVCRAIPNRAQIHAKKRKSKIWRVRSTSNRAQIHAKKEKARFGVCRAIPNRAQVHAKKEKARFGVCGAPPIGHKYTPKRKKQDLACAEHPPTARPPPQRLQDEIFIKPANLTRNYLLYKTTKA